MKIIEQHALNNWLSINPDWIYVDDEIVFEKQFKDFITAFGFLSSVAIVMEKHNHHPKIENSYGMIKLSMNTHDAECKITDRDLNLAEEINRLIK